MDGQEYLNQISAKNRPLKAPKRGIFSSKYFIISAIGVGALILIIIIGSLLGGGKGGEKNTGSALILHLNNTTEEIQKYQLEIKSSDLRSSSASLQSLLSTTSKDLTTYMEEKYDFKDNKVEKKMLAEADAAKEELDAELFDAKITGALDRTFAHKMAYEITLIQNEEVKMMKETKNDDVKSGLQKSYDSLEVLYPKFNDFSEAK